jgi:DNA-directed RNA polymerase specialized sigma24 family protein
MQQALSFMDQPVALERILSDPALRRDLTRFVRTRAPESEVEDIVQSTLTEALASEHAPAEAEEIRRWVFGIARHKIVDCFRQAGRESPVSVPPEDSAMAESAPLSARDLLRWAERELPEGEQSESTLDWMMREASGDKLESIAAEHQVPAARVRQRVWRLRRHFRERWALAAAVAAVLVVGGLVTYVLTEETAPVEIVREAAPTPEQRAFELRRLAQQDCERGSWQRCVERLDEARRIDPAGDGKPAVQQARSQAAAALRPVPSSLPVPTTSEAPPTPDSTEKAPRKLAPPTTRPKGEEAPTPAKPKAAPQKASKAPNYSSDFGSDDYKGK